jgi:hypothetical protein
VPFCCLFLILLGLKLLLLYRLVWTFRFSLYLFLFSILIISTVAGTSLALYCFYIHIKVAGSAIQWSLRLLSVSPTCIPVTQNDDSLLFPTSISDESTKETIVSRRLWERSNMERYVAEMRRESKHRR